MIIKCKECKNDVSDKAMLCPHCGISLKRKRSNSHMRLPNGFGQITKIKGNLRNPYRAMVTTGKDLNGKPICKLLKPQAYFKTYNEAYEALMRHHANPYDQSPVKTILDLYNEWHNEWKKGKNIITDPYASSCWPRCKEIYDTPITELKPMMLKNIIESAVCSSAIKTNMKSMFSLMYDYAIQYEYTDKNPARMLTLSYNITSDKEIKNPHSNFTEKEIDLLWANIDYSRTIPALLIQCYMGWRPQELCIIRTEDVNINEWTIKGGMKTNNGKDRVVPVHPKIQPLVEMFYNNAIKYNSEYFLTDARGYVLTFNNYRHYFKNILHAIGIEADHKSHDGRVTFVTKCKEYGVDEYAIKYMVGHAIKDLTERTYTKRNIEWLRSELEKIEKEEGL